MAKAFDIMTFQRLRALPVHNAGEVWEIGIVGLEVDLFAAILDESDLKAFDCVVCVSSRDGGFATDDSELGKKLTATCGLEVVAVMALEKSPGNVKPRKYLPSLIRVSGLPKAAIVRLTESMGELGVKVEVSDDQPALDSFRSLAAEMSRKHAEEMNEELSGDMENRWDMPPLMKVKGMSIAQIRSFALAAADYWEAKPWLLFKSEVVWDIQSPKIKTPAMRACIAMGVGGEAQGVAFLTSSLEFYAMHLQQVMQGPVVASEHTLWSVLYDKASKAPSGDDSLWIDEKLPLADSEGFPLAMGVTRSRKIVRPSTDQLNVMEGILRVLTSLTRKEAKSPANTVIVREVETFEGPMTVTLKKGGQP